MKLTNVKLILAREIRDQLRDRRTLFMIFVLPLLLYPLLGIGMSQMTQFRADHPITVLVFGAENVAIAPALIEKEHFAASLFGDQKGPEAFDLILATSQSRAGAAAKDPRDEARRAVQAGSYEGREIDAALYFSPEFGRKLEAFRQAVREQGRKNGAVGHDEDKALVKGPQPSPPAPLPTTMSTWCPGEGSSAPSPPAQAGEGKPALQVPFPDIFRNRGKSRSEVAYGTLRDVLDRWLEEIGNANLVASGVPAETVKPFGFQVIDVDENTSYQGAATWSRILPVLLLIWAMTGAFYPAVDLCAGEKERGTLETLLSSPAERSEIVVGKLLTVMLFSALSSALNLVSVGTTGCLVFGQMTEFRAPPPLAVLWLAIALVPVSALFSALCLALASFARSTKEGQYYLMPLLLITLPLAVVPMTPGVELTLGNSLIPVTGIVLLLKSLLEGSYLQALQFLPLVLGVTLVACWLAVRWAVEQFNSEAVLFRESERFSLGLWLRHLLRDRRPTPTAAAAICCGVVILLARFVMSSFVPDSDSFRGFAIANVIMQVSVILGPALVMAIALTSSPRQTLLLRLPRLAAIPAAVMLAVAAHPLVVGFTTVIQRLYPIPSEVNKMLTGLEAKFVGAGWWELLLVFALVPAVCEEFAFRGFILSGLRQLGGKWRAIVLSALLFGIAHGFLQQSINACVLGVMLGFLAVQCRSLLPGILFHLIHNSLTVGSSWITPAILANHRWLGWFMNVGDKGVTYPWHVCLIGGLLSVLLLAWFARLPAATSPDEAVEPAWQDPAEQSTPESPAVVCM